MSMQVKLLRVLQEREVVRLGSRKAMPLDVRLVAATNVDLAKAVSAGRFRADLYYRIGWRACGSAPLRERPADLLPLARHFVAEYAARLKLSAPVLRPDSLDALLAYAWPGNIRELENVLHNAVLIARDGLIRPEDLRFAGIEPEERRLPASTQDSLEQVFQRLLAAPGEALFERVEASLLKLAFERNRRNQVRTAETLGLSRHAVRTLLKRHHLMEG